MPYIHVHVIQLSDTNLQQETLSCWSKVWIINKRQGLQIEKKGNLKHCFIKHYA